MSKEYKEEYNLPLHHIQDLEHVSLGLKKRVLDLLEKELKLNQIETTTLSEAMKIWKLIKPCKWNIKINWERRC